MIKILRIMIQLGYTGRRHYIRNELIRINLLGMGV